MKALLVGDCFISGKVIYEQFKVIEKYGVDISYIQWGPEDTVEDLTRKNLNIERYGPSAEQPPPELSEYINKVEILIVHFCPVSAAIINKGKRLRFIGCLRGGYENINVKTATEKGVIVVNTPGRNANAVAEFTIGLMLAESRNIVRAHASLQKGIWQKKFVNSGYLFDMKGKTVGIIGFGQVGRRLVKKLSGFEVNILVYDPYVSQDVIIREGANPVDLRFLLKKSDYVTLHARVTPDNKRMIGSKEIALMKPTAYFFNVARSGLIDEKALYTALKDKKIGGAALDVFDKEPLPFNSPLLKLPNITLTSHLAGTTWDALLNSPRMLVKDVERFCRREKPKFVVNSKKED